MSRSRIGVGVFASALPAWCRCGELVPAGRMRPWLGPGRPLCARCAVQLGLGDVEGLVDAFDKLAAMLPGAHVVLSRLRHAAAEHAADRLAEVADRLDAAGPADD